MQSSRQPTSSSLIPLGKPLQLVATIALLFKASSETNKSRHEGQVSGRCLSIYFYELFVKI